MLIPVKSHNLPGYYAEFLVSRKSFEKYGVFLLISSILRHLAGFFAACFFRNHLEISRREIWLNFFLFQFD